MKYPYNSIYIAIVIHVHACNMTIIIIYSITAIDLFWMKLLCGVLSIINKKWSRFKVLPIGVSKVVDLV